MSLDIGTALQLAGDVASDAKNPAQAVYDALTLYRAFKAAEATPGSAAAALLALDKAGQFDSAVDAIADLAPTLQAVKNNKDHKAKLMTLLASMG